MSEPITIPLTVHHQRRFAEIRSQQAILTAQLNEAVTAIVGVTHDPADLLATGHSVHLSPDGQSLVIVAPTPTAPTLVKDIGPDGVSESAATG